VTWRGLRIRARQAAIVVTEASKLDRIAGRIGSCRGEVWESYDAIKAFAGEDYETAVFYPEDDRYLVERDLTSAHYEVARSAP
jgi:hypothetical protein